MNPHLDDRNKLMVFPKGGPFLPTKKVGKNNPKAEFIKETNRLKDKWNDEVRHALMNGAPKDSLIAVKKELISKPAAESIRESGDKSDPAKYNSIIARAIMIIAEMCRLLKRETHETWAEVWGKALSKLMEMAIQNVGYRIYSKEKERDYVR